MTASKDNSWRLETGGARDYLTLFRDEIIPFVERTYRADSDRRILTGQCFGGLFGVYALIEEPGLFQDYILTGPSLWFDNEIMFQLEEKAAKAGRNLSGRVYFATGETETPATGRKRFYGSGSVWSAQLAAMMFTTLQTLLLWGINPRHWLNSYLTACAENNGNTPTNLSPFLPWKMTERRLQTLCGPIPQTTIDDPPLLQDSG